MAGKQLEVSFSNSLSQIQHQFPLPFTTFHSVADTLDPYSSYYLRSTHLDVTIVLYCGNKQPQHK